MNEPLVPTKVAFEKHYPDDSGVNYGVYYDATSEDQRIRIEHIDSVDIEEGQIDWLIECLQEVKKLLLLVHSKAKCEAKSPETSTFKQINHVTVLKIGDYVFYLDKWSEITAIYIDDGIKFKNLECVCRTELVGLYFSSGDLPTTIPNT